MHFAGDHDGEHRCHQRVASHAFRKSAESFPVSAVGSRGFAVYVTYVAVVHRFGSVAGDLCADNVQA